MGEELEIVNETENTQSRATVYSLRALGGLGVGGGLTTLALGVNEFTGDTLWNIFQGERLLATSAFSLAAGACALIKSGVIRNWFA